MVKTASKVYRKETNSESVLESKKDAIAPKKPLNNGVNHAENDPVFDNSANSAKNDGSTKRAFAWFENEKGEVLLDRMRQQTKLDFKAFLEKKEVRREFGLDRQEIEDSPAFDSDEADTILDMLGNVDAVAAQRIFKFSPAVCSEAFAFKEEHRKKINPRLIRLLNKWGPMVLKNWKDEIGLAMILFSVMSAQVRMAYYLDAKEKKAAKGPIPVTEMPAPSGPGNPPQESIDAVIDTAETVLS